MPYRFATDSQNYADFASGRVFFNAPRQPVLPVRLASEILQRCLAHRQAMRLSAPIKIYDPCCGSAYHLGVLGYLHGEQIDSIIGSDIDPEILVIAKRNLNLLTRGGLLERQDVLTEMADRFGKQSHLDALQSVERLKLSLPHPQIALRVFSADATDPQAISQATDHGEIDIILADIPYGQKSSWQSKGMFHDEMLYALLNALSTISSKHTIIAIVADKAQKCQHQQFERIERFQIGKRRVHLLRSVI